MNGLGKKLGIIGLAAFLLGTLNLYAKDPIYTGFLSDAAAGGYDVVAYFTEGKPVEGKDDYSTEYKGADWYFSSGENLIAFEQNPERYAPAYGGYCAWAVAQGYTAKGDPQFWTIHEGRLFLNYDANVQNKWLKEKQHLINEADKYWPDVLED
jgi:YHS domain-containing protein